MTCSDTAATPLFLECRPYAAGLNFNQLWIFRQPDTTSNQYNVIMNAKTGYVIDVAYISTKPGSFVWVYERNNQDNEQFQFTIWMEDH